MRIFHQLKYLGALVERAVSAIARFSNPDHTELPKILAATAHIDPQLKARMFYLLRDLRSHRRRRAPFGMLVVLGWDGRWTDAHASVPDSDQNIFHAAPADLRALSDREALTLFASIADFDGAVLIDREGRCVASGIHLENMRPKEAARLVSSGASGDLSSAFGFARKVHTRHLNAIAASYWLPETTVYVVSEEDGSVRIFEQGKIIWSVPHGGEAKR